MKKYQTFSYNILIAHHLIVFIRHLFSLQVLVYLMTDNILGF